MEPHYEEPGDTDEDDEIDFHAPTQFEKVGVYLALTGGLIVLAGAIYLTVTDAESLGTAPRRNMVADSGTRFVNGPILFTLSAGMFCIPLWHWVANYIRERKKK